MNNRAVLLPYPGDPFLLRYWLELFDTVWGAEISTLYVYLNSPIEPEVVDYIRAMCASRRKINFQYEPHQIEHGAAIDRMLDIVVERYVMLIEDDAFIFKPGHVDRCFRYLESDDYKIVASKRGSCSNEISLAAQEKWGISYLGEGDVGCNFWPNFFFCSQQLLRSTDRNFGARAWNRGETIEPLGCVVDVDVVAGDTFVNTSLQLRAMVKDHDIAYVPQYHGHPDDVRHYEQGKYLFDGRAWWTHVGSLSTGIGGVLRTEYNRPLATRFSAFGGIGLSEQKPKTEMEKLEWERRVQWWLTFWQTTNPLELPEFHRLYGEAIEKLIVEFELNRSRIRERQHIYRTLGL